MPNYEKNLNQWTQETILTWQNLQDQFPDKALPQPYGTALTTRAGYSPRLAPTGPATRLPK